MKREILDNALYQVVTLIDKDDERYTGWFVPEQKGKGYSILPLDNIWVIYTYPASCIKDIIYATNGCSLKELSKHPSPIVKV